MNGVLMKIIILSLKNMIGLGSGNERTNKAKKNIAASFIIKGVNIAISLILVPITIKYLNATNYGIWITLTSLVSWFGFFDIGLGNGLKNRFAEALAANDHKLAKTYVSTTYAILTIIISFVLLCFYIINMHINWSIILNTQNNPSIEKELRYLAFGVFTTFGVTFVLNLIAVILTADQKPAKGAIFDLLGKSLALLIIIILIQVSRGSLLTFGLIYCSISPIILAISTIWFFNGKYKQYCPSIKYIDFKKAKDLFNLGVKFFVIQIAAIVLYQTNNIIITQLFGPAMVTPYSIAFKYFSILMMGFMIIVSPFWSAITEAWVMQDINWIRKIINKLMKLWLVLIILGLLMLLSASFVFKIWIGKNFSVQFSILILTLIWILLTAWNGIFSQFLNGVSKIKIQLIIGIFAAIINIPLAIILGKMIGIEGILLSNIILGLTTVIIYPIQYKKIINKKAIGIFNS